jgi:hypothetical protein
MPAVQIEEACAIPAGDMYTSRANWFKIELPVNLQQMLLFGFTRVVGLVSHGLDPPRPWVGESGSFIQTQLQIHPLDCATCGTLNQIVDGDKYSHY